MIDIIQGDCLETLQTLPAESVNCCITSPPYWGLRDYGVSDQLGLEKTPEEYVSNMVKVFREVKRVLKPEGTLWLNLGDSYYGGGWKGAPLHEGSGSIQKGSLGTHCGESVARDPKHHTIKTKDLVGIPWMVAFALRADGWWLRQDIIWHKPNPMPESVKDRCTKAHEYIFLMAKSQKYFCDMEAIKEESIDPESHSGRRERNAPQIYHHDKANCKNAGSVGEDGKLKSGMVYETRNKRSVWTVTTKPYKEAHFATFPEDLITPCVLAGCPEGGTILDPFFGAGTTGVVAERWGRNCIGLELNPEYVKIADNRVNKEHDKMGLFND